MMENDNNRRGQADMLEWFPRIMMMTVAVIIIVMLVRVYTDRDVDTPDLHRATYLYRLYYGDIIMYSDPKTMRVYPGIVDVSKVTTEKLDAVFNERDPAQVWAKISSRITIIPAEGCAVSVPVAYNNKETFDKFSLLSNVQMAGGATEDDVTFPVTIKDGARTCAGLLNITIVRPNT